jgi:hypothetical protein
MKPSFTDSNLKASPQLSTSNSEVGGRPKRFTRPATESRDNFDPLRARRSRSNITGSPSIISWGDLAAHPWLLW